VTKADALLCRLSTAVSVSVSLPCTLALKNVPLNDRSLRALSLLISLLSVGSFRAVSSQNQSHLKMSLQASNTLFIGHLTPVAEHRPSFPDYISTLQIEAAGYSETLVTIYQIT
jgi:hypothetical protein